MGTATWKASFSEMSGGAEAMLLYGDMSWHHAQSRIRCGGLLTPDRPEGPE